MTCLLVVSLAAVFVAHSSAFAIQPQTDLRQRNTKVFMVGGGENNPLGGGELTSTLARLDQQWKIQQRSSAGKSRWTKIILPNEDTGEEITEQAPTIETQQDFVYLLEPPNSIPSCVLVFVGGAGLGQFPQLTYSEMLMRISDKLNAAIITTPYQVGLDHFSLSKQSGERLRRAIAHCQEDPARQYPTTLPTYCLAHSLGAKLQTIYMAATQQQYDGVGFLSYNNFGFSQTLQMAKVFAKQLRAQSESAQDRATDEMLNTIFDFAEQAIGVIGIDFSPRKEDMNRLIQLKYDDELQRKTRLFVFDEDALDSSRSFVENCQGEGPSLSGLPGNHLTPVYFKLGLNDLDLPEEAREMAAEATGGITSASFGNEDELNTLVDEVCNWILGKGPSRGPNWEEDVDIPRQPPRIAGGVEDYSI